MRTALLVALVVVVVAVVSALPSKPKKVVGQEVVDYVNAQGKWKAALHPRFAGKTHEEVRKHLGARKIRDMPKHRQPKPRPASNRPNDDIPDTFDARTGFPACTDVIGTIGDQSACGSCWAVSTALAMSDRICIATNGTNKTPVSADDINSCCYDCGDGCDGGWPYEAFDFWTTEGVVSGSGYTADAGCDPYPFAPCEHHNTKTTYPSCDGQWYDTPACAKKCQTSYKQRTYKEDKTFGQDLFYYSQQNEDVQREIMKYGSVVVAFDVYEDFLSYQSGVYEHLTGDMVGGHAVRAIGWGNENGKDYWLLANQWNADWGDNGLVKFIRGQDDCGIEDEIVAGGPDVGRLPTWN